MRRDAFDGKSFDGIAGWTRMRRRRHKGGYNLGAS
jgi:hypothetical protein